MDNLYNSPLVKATSIEQPFAQPCLRTAPLLNAKPTKNYDAFRNAIQEGFRLSFASSKLLQKEKLKHSVSMYQSRNDQHAYNFNKSISKQLKKINGNFKEVIVKVKLTTQEQGMLRREAKKAKEAQGKKLCRRYPCSECLL